MCGIVGLLGREDKALVRRMADRISHRGPDGAGVWSDTGVTLGHRRLAILDVAHGNQPMQSADGRYCIVYNGECYNHEELRRHLPDVAWRTTTDTETVLEGFAAWGPEVVTRMEGMFAFAVWDLQERRLFVARDPFGIKPFFYAHADGDWIFASEQKALFVHPGRTPMPDLDRVRERAALEFLTGQATLFAGVHQLPPGTWAWLYPDPPKDGGRPGGPVAWIPYHHVPVELYASPEEAAHAIKDRFVASVQEQLMSDVPLGVILSGGLDSTAVAAVHQSLSDDPIHTFTIAESEKVADFQAARRLADHLGTDHHEVFFTFDDVVQGLPHYTWHNENINYTEFFFDPLFAFMRKTVTVGLCGQGSDELWGGYARYKDPLALARDRLERIRRAAPAHAEELATQVVQTHTSGQSLAEWDQQGQLSNFQLRLVDRNSMAHSVEVRVPFLSRPLLQASRAVPWGWKLHPTGARNAPGGEGAPEPMEKWILRKALSEVGLPDDLVWRRKVPAGRATGPGVMDRFEAYADRLVSDRAWNEHPLHGSFRRRAEQLVFDLWQEIFVHRQGDIKGLTLEDLA